MGVGISNVKTTMLMKLRYLAIGLLCAGFFSCTDDEIANPVQPANPGDEIQFSAQQNSNGFHNTDNPTTRTHYGYYSKEDKEHYAIYWDNGDHIAIYSPQARATEPDSQDKGREQDYKIILQDSGEDQQKGTLSKINPSDVGLQWGEDDKHDFFAFYPYTVKEDIVNATTLRMTLPAVQTPSKIRTEDDLNGDGIITLPSGNTVSGTMYVAEPNMNNCFMYAHSVGYRTQDTPISLDFKPIPTTLEIILKGPEEGEEPIQISQVVIRCAKDIVGAFDLTIAELDDPNDGATKTVDDGLLSNTITIPTYYNPTTNETSGEGLEPVTLRSGDAIVLRAFMLPVDFEVNQCAVTVHMVGKGSRTKVLDTGALEANTINITEMPKLKAAESNYWMTMLDPNVYFSQLSIPGSHNSYNFPVQSGAESIPTDNSTISSYYQTKNIAEQLNAGARAFSFQVGFRETNSEHANAISDEGWQATQGRYPLVVYAGTSETSETLESVLKNFADELDKLNDNYYTAFPAAEQYGKKPQEFIVVNVTFTQRGGQEDRKVELYRWLKELDETMERLRSDKRFTNQVNAGTTISDLIGKVVVFVNYQGEEWPEHTFVVEEGWWLWGEDETATYSYDVATRPENYIVLKEGSKEDGTAMDFFGSNDRDYTDLFHQPVYGVGLSSSGIDLWRQNLERLNNSEWSSGNTTWLGDRIQKKKKLIKGLFDKAVDNNTEGINVGNWYFNNIGCFEVVDQYKSYNSGDGEGGNVVQAAKEINSYTYQYLANPTNNSAPCGVVLMNLFGESEVKGTQVYSRELQQIIIDNNYRFQLKVKSSGSGQ